MNKLKDVIQLRVRYSETDQMGTFYNSRALEWFECGARIDAESAGMSYAVLEEKAFPAAGGGASRIPGGARYDDLLRITSTAELHGRAKLRSTLRLRTAGPAVLWSVATRPRVHRWTGQTNPAA